MEEENGMRACADAGIMMVALLTILRLTSELRKTRHGIE
jgi:hypothetical protein